MNGGRGNKIFHYIKLFFNSLISEFFLVKVDIFKFLRFLFFFCRGRVERSPTRNCGCIRYNRVCFSFSDRKHPKIRKDTKIWNILDDTSKTHDTKLVGEQIRKIKINQQKWRNSRHLCFVSVFLFFIFAWFNFSFFFSFFLLKTFLFFFLIISFLLLWI